MFDIGWTEMLVIAVVMIVIVGPKDLPKMLRTFGKTTAKLRSMAGDFQKQFNDALKEAELDDVKKSVDSLRSLNPANEIKKQLNPFEKAAADVRAGLDKALKPAAPATGGTAAAAGTTAAAAAASTPVSAEPAPSPVVSGPTDMPPPPVFAAPEAAAAATAPAAPAAAEAAKPAPAKRAATAKKTGEKAETTDAPAAPARKKKTGSTT
jgi:sec-independent protein translocase protein TatB